MIFYDPNGSAAQIIERFQTLFGGIFATVAAAFTALVVYRSATEPLRAAAKREEAAHEARKLVANALVANALREVLSQTHDYVAQRRGPTVFANHMVHRPLELPPILRDMEALEVIEPDAMWDIGTVLNIIAAFNRVAETTKNTNELIALSATLYDHAHEARRLLGDKNVPPVREDDEEYYSEGGSAP